MIRIGLISDTHGLLRPPAVDFLQGSDFIVHAGDIGDPGILAALNVIAPVTVVRGNNDREPWAHGLRQTQRLHVGAFVLLAIHDLAELDIDPALAGVHAVVSGHSHRPSVGRRCGVLYVNPGSAGPRRFALPVSVGELLVDGLHASARTMNLEIERSARGA